MVTVKIGESRHLDIMREAEGEKVEELHEALELVSVIMLAAV